MPKSKKPPAQAAEGKPSAAKPGASKSPPPPRPPATSSRPGVPPPAAAKAAPVVKTLGAKTLGAKTPAVKTLVVSGSATGKPAVKTAAPAGKAPAKNGPAPKPVGAKPLATKKTPKVVEPPQPAEPRKWPKGGPTKVELKHYRDRLLEMRRALLSSSKELAAEALKSSGQDFSVDHMADHGSDNYEQDFSLKLLEGESEQLADIREALMKIDGKVETPFGICEACADEDQKLCETCPWIPPSRLEVLPHARLCVQTKEIEERRRQ